MFLSRRTLKKESKEGVALDGQPSTLTKELKTLPFLTASCYDEEHKPGGFYKTPKSGEAGVVTIPEAFSLDL